MATIKFSEFDPGNINAGGAEIVGLEGGTNKRFTAADLVNGLATVTYVDAQDTNLQNQITQNTNDIANIDIDVGNIELDTSNIEANIVILQGNVVVLEGAVAALENNVSVNQDDIATLQGNIVTIENELANIADTDAQNLSWDGANANLSISNGNNVVLQEVLDNASNITTIQGNITVIEQQISELEANGNIQNLSWDSANANLSISGGNTVTLTGLGGGGNYSNANVQALGEAGWTGNIIPSANITYDLGNATNRWKDLYLSNSTIYLGGQTISVDNDGTIAFSGNISAPAMVDDTLLIINDGTLTTSQAGSTDGLEWEAVVIPNSADGEIIKEVVGNDSGILAFTRYAEITYSLDNGVTWNMLHIIDDLGYSAFGRYDFTVAYYSPGLDLFYILGDDGYYFTTSDFQTFSGQQQANVNWGTLGYEVPTITESDTRILFVEPSSRKGYYADISNPSVWTQVANLGLPVQSDCDVHYTGSAFVIISLGDQTCRVSTDNGVTWSSGGDLRGGISGNYFSKDSSVDPDTGTLVVGMNFNSLTISTDNGLNWTLTDMSSIFTAYPSNAQLRNVSYGAGLWCINASSSSMGSPWWDTQYVSEDITDLNTWKIVSTPLPGPYSIEGQTYINGNFWGPGYDLLFKLEWPVGTQVLLFNDEVVATRNDIAYVVSAQAQAQAEKVSTKELEILSKTFDGNANVSQSSTLTYSANSLVISDAVTMGGPFRLVNMTTTERDALSAANGDMIYNTTTSKLQGYQNGSWINLDGT